MLKGILRNLKKKINNIQQDLQSVNTVSIDKDQWNKFVSHTKSFENLVLATMFQDAHFMSFDGVDYVVSVSFLKKFIIFKDLLDNEKQQWLLGLQNIFGHQVQLKFNFDGITDQTKKVVQQERVVQRKPSSNQSSVKVTRNKLDLSDTTKWKLANELMKHFDGIITEISGDVYE